MLLSSIPLAICRSPLQRGLLQLAWKITAHFSPKESRWVPDRKCSKTYVYQEQMQVWVAQQDARVKAQTEGDECPCAGSTQPTACHTASSTRETGKQFLSAPVPKPGKGPVRRCGLSFHCYFYPYLTPPSCWCITCIRFFSEHVKKCLKQSGIWVVTSTDNSWFAKKKNSWDKMFVRKVRVTRKSSFV